MGTLCCCSNSSIESQPEEETNDIKYDNIELDVVKEEEEIFVEEIEDENDTRIMYELLVFGFIRNAIMTEHMAISFPLEILNLFIDYYPKQHSVFAIGRNSGFCFYKYCMTNMSLN